VYAGCPLGCINRQVGLPQPVPHQLISATGTIVILVVFCKIIYFAFEGNIAKLLDLEQIANLPCVLRSTQPPSLSGTENE